MIKGGGGLKGFAIAGAAKKFVWAKAKIVDAQVVTWNDQVTEPAAPRCAWANNSADANLYNEAGLPASPLITEE